jgi:Tol biopolymer transport system component
MMRMSGALLALSALVALASPAYAGDPGSGLPLAPARKLEREVTSGTWMSLAVSPDGKTILFDMLGEIYAMPAKGGKARLLLGGMAFETQPTFSPDGKWIAFVSDRSGSDNLWIAQADGAGPRQLTFSDDETVYASPEWRADGKAVFVSHYRPDLNNYALLLQPLDGAGSEVVGVRTAPTQNRDEWKSALGASASRDGRWLYYARRVGGLDFDVIRQWTIVRRDLQSGEETVLISGPGGRGGDKETFFRPQVSPDGKLLAYATHRAGETELRVRTLASGEDRSLGLIEPDALRASTWQDIVPRYAFTPDSAAVIVSRNGGIERRSLDGNIAPIPFRARLALDVGPSTRVRLREPTGAVPAHLPQAAITSPDGGQVAFSAFGRIYVQPVDGSVPAHAVSGAGDPAFQPSWSPDGKAIAFVSWSEAAGGAVWTIPADGSAPPKRVDDGSAFYTYPVFDPAGGRLLTLRSAAAARQQSGFEIGVLRDSELVALPLAGGKASVVTSGKLGGRVQFASVPGKAWIYSGDGIDTLDLTTGKRSPLVQVKGAAYYFQESPVAVDDMRISPDGKWLLGQVAEQLHIVAMPQDGAKEVDLLSTSLPHRQLTDIGADYFNFTRDGGIEWSVGPQFWRMDSPSAMPRRLADLAVSMPRATPKGTVVLRGARVLTMAGGDRVIDHADVVVTDDRIVAVGPKGSVNIPEGATIRDVTGKTILPGFIDEHDHIGSIRREVLSFEDWSLRARLAYGVTTSFDPSTLSIDMITYQDAIDAGLVLGPRLRSTGPALFSYNRFTSLDQVRAVLRRYRDAYGLGNIKEYRTGNRRVRQWVAQAVRELGLQPTTEGALSLKLDLTQIIDGYAGNEHALPATLEDDVLGLLVDMRTSYATTLMITNSGPEGADWFVAERDPINDPKMQRFWPPTQLRQKLLDRPWVSLTEERFPAVARDAALLAARGGLVGMGAHGEVPGIGFHWEMEAHAMGGMKPMAVLHAATAGSAETIGRLDDLGTIEQGKLADLVILDRDPLANIRNTTSIGAVMRGGTLYDGNTLAELWPVAGPPPQASFAKPAGERWLPAPEGK